METQSKHIILGAGGAIGNILARTLLSHGEKVRLVSRSERHLEGAESAKADLTDARGTLDVVEDMSVVYLLPGLPYDFSIWQKTWPMIMKNAIEACSAKNSRLIFFDNVYAYGKVDGPMTESSPINPSSRKGELRAKIADELLSAAKGGKVDGLIARSADFYGPYADNTSLPFIFFFKRLAEGRKAQFLVSAKRKHSFTYSGDCGDALYLLAKTEDASKQVWHLPTAKPPLTGEEFIAIVARKLGVKPRYTILRKWMVGLSGIFNRRVREVYEMLYQNQYDYIFDSSKFESRFNFTPTPYETGITGTIDHLRGRGLI